MVFAKTYVRLNLSYEAEDKNSPNAIKGFTGAYKFLSNFAPSNYELKGETFHCVEQGYMWCKDTSEIYRSNIMRAPTPQLCKRIGRTANLPPEWDTVRRYRAMFDNVLAKYEQNYYLAERLLATEYRYLEETNAHGDRHWGVCNALGENHLGRLTMCVRSELQRKLKHGHFHKRTSG